MAPACHNWRKPSHRNEDPTQPKINKINKFITKNIVYVPCGVWDVRELVVLRSSDTLLEFSGKMCQSEHSKKEMPHSMRKREIFFFSHAHTVFYFYKR